MAEGIRFQGHRSMSDVWWLFGLCGVLEGILAAFHILMLNPDGVPVWRRFALPGTVWEMGMLALAAGACAIGAGLWTRGRGYGWLVVLHGLALSSFGILAGSPLVRGPLSFGPVSVLLAVMAASAGAFALASAATRAGARKKWFWNAAGAVLLGYTSSFLAVGSGWVRLGAPYGYWIWMGGFFGCCAVLMLWLASDVKGLGFDGCVGGSAFPPVTQ